MTAAQRSRGDGVGGGVGGGDGSGSGGAVMRQRGGPAMRNCACGGATACAQLSREGLGAAERADSVVQYCIHYILTDSVSQIRSPY